jgi:hypothetical protein
MGKHYINFAFLVVSSAAWCQVQGVGINETIPQQALHLGSPTSTVRVEGLNETNNSYNLGATNTYPLYVDNLGSLTLRNSGAFNSDGNDAFVSVPNSTIILLNGDNDGIADGEILNFTITTSRPTIVLVKYTLSFEVFQNVSENKLTDKLARRINTYFRLNNGTRKYGHASKCFTSSATNDVSGELYNMSSSYIVIPTAGTHTISLHGEVSSGLTNSTSNTGKATCVVFGRGHDSLMYKVN